MSEKRTQLVVWSGGLDSTLVLYNLGKASSKSNSVIAVSFRTNFIDELKAQNI